MCLFNQKTSKDLFYKNPGILTFFVCVVITYVGNENVLSFYQKYYTPFVEYIDKNFHYLDSKLQNIFALL